MELDSSKVDLPFTLVEQSIPYLGIHLAASIADLYAANYPPLLKQITNLLKQ